MRDIAEKAGISKSGLYHYFPTKESLFQFCGSQLKRATESAITAETPVEQLLEITRLLSKTIVDELYLILDYIKSSPAAQTLEGEDGTSMTYEYKGMIEKIAGERKSGILIPLIFGELLITSLEGGRFDEEKLRKNLESILNS